MTTATQTLTDFLLARIAEDEAAARAVPPLDHNFDMGGARQDERFTFGRTLPSSADGMGNWSKHRDDPSTAAHFLRHDPARVLAECEAKRRIVELHKSWPVLVQRQPSFEQVDSTDVNSMVFRASQQIAWATEQEYRAKFGDEPPTAPMLRALASVYADHPDYNPDWRP